MSQRWTLIAAVLGSSIVFVDSSVVTVALPKIGRELPTTVLGVLEGQLYVYEHPDYWQCMDTYRDWDNLEKQWQSGRAPWKVWA